MAARAPAAPKRRYRAETNDPHLLLAKRRFSPHSDETWKEARKDSHRPALHNQLNKWESDLLESAGGYSERTVLAKGAYHSLPRLVRQLLSMYIELGALAATNDAVTIKITFDQRYLRGRSNVAFIVALCDVVNMQAPRLHHHTFALAEATESVPHLSAMMAEMRLDDAIAELKEERFSLGGVTVCLNIKMVFDWMSGCALFDMAVPWTPNPAAVVCPWCLCNKGWLRSGWRREPFAFCALVDVPTALLTNVTTADCRYCPMHGCTRLLCGTLQSLRALAPHGRRGAFDECVATARLGWTRDTSLRCCEMKRIVTNSQLLRDLAALFPEDELRMQRAGGGGRVLTLRNAVHMLLDAIRAYHDFVYTRKPLPADFAALEAARISYLAFYCAQEWAIAPAPHYMLDHLPVFAKLDGTAYFALQEAAEHKHCEDREDIKHTAGVGATSGRSGYQQMLDQQETRRLLTGLGYGPPERRPPRLDLGVGARAVLAIRRPLYAE